MKIENYVDLILKNAYDKNGEKLGKIVHFLEKETSEKQSKMFIYVESKKHKQDYIRVPIEESKIFKIKGRKVWFDILKEEFDNLRAKLKETVRKREPIYHEPKK